MGAEYAATPSGELQRHFDALNNAGFTRMVYFQHPTQPASDDCSGYGLTRWTHIDGEPPPAICQQPQFGVGTPCDLWAAMYDIWRTQ